MNTQSVGKEGEDLAVAYLLKHKYKIKERNFRKNWGEIDIVAEDEKTKELVFIEVKTRKGRNLSSLHPEEMLTPKKINHLRRVFLSYLSYLGIEDISWRFDFIAIEIDEPFFLPSIHHYKNLFLEF